MITSSPLVYVQSLLLVYKCFPLDNTATHHQGGHGEQCAAQQDACGCRQKSDRRKWFCLWGCVHWSADPPDGGHGDETDGEREQIHPCLLVQKAYFMWWIYYKWYISFPVTASNTHNTVIIQNLKPWCVKSVLTNAVEPPMKDHQPL